MHECVPDPLHPGEKNSFVIAFAPLNITPDLNKIVTPALSKFGYTPINWMHITLAIFKDHNDMERICSETQKITSTMNKLLLGSTGFHVFKKQHVVCLKVEKSPELVRLRKTFLSLFYNQSIMIDLLNWRWIPHISIIYTDNNDYRYIYRDLKEILINCKIDINALTIRDLFTYEKIYPIGE